VQGAEASKISKLNNSSGISSLLKKSLMSSQNAYFGFKLSLYSINAEQVLDDLFFEAIKGVEILKPKVVIFENVMGLLFKKNKTYVDKIINKLTECGYSIALIELYQYLSNQGHHSQPVYTPSMSHQHPQKN
jgi:hypothetical protein